MGSSLFELGNPPLALWSIKASLVVIRLISFLGPGGVLPVLGRQPPKGVPLSVFWYCIGILLVEVYEREGKSVISICKMA